MSECEALIIASGRCLGVEREYCLHVIALLSVTPEKLVRALSLLASAKCQTQFLCKAYRLVKHDEVIAVRNALEDCATQTCVA